MPAVAETGPYVGHLIRTARKDWPCENYRRSDPRHHSIRAGERYVEGDVNPCYAGGFGNHRICLKCGGMA